MNTATMIQNALKKEGLIGTHTSRHICTNGDTIICIVNNVESRTAHKGCSRVTFYIRPNGEKYRKQFSRVKADARFYDEFAPAPDSFVIDVDGNSMGYS